MQEIKKKGFWFILFCFLRRLFELDQQMISIKSNTQARKKQLWQCLAFFSFMLNVFEEKAIFYSV